MKTYLIIAVLVFAFGAAAVGLAVSAFHAAGYVTVLG